MKWFLNETSATVCLTGSGVGAIVSLGSKRASPMFWHLPAPQPPEADPVAQFRQALAWVNDVTTNEFVDIRLYLSDGWLHHRLLELEDFPADRKMRDRLVRWRVAQEMEVPEDALAVAWQPAMPAARGIRAVYATALECTLKNALNEAALDSGYALSHLRSLFHGIHAIAAPHVDEGTLGWLDDDHWLTLRINGGGVTAVRTQRGGGEEAVAAFQRDIARGVTEQEVRRVRIQCTESREVAATRVAAALAETVGDVDASARIFPHECRLDQPELVRLAARLGEVA